MDGSLADSVLYIQAWLPVFFINTLFYLMWHYRKFDLIGGELEVNATYSASSEPADSEASCGLMSIKNSVSGNLQVCIFRPLLKCIEQKYLFQVVNSSYCVQATLAVYGSARLFFFAVSRVNNPNSLQPAGVYL